MTNFNGGTGFCGSGAVGNLNVDGDLEVSGIVKLADGTDAAPSLAYTAQPSTGFTRSGSGEVSYVTSGSKRVRLNTTGIQVDTGSLKLIGGTPSRTTELLSTDDGLDIKIDSDTPFSIDVDTGVTTVDTKLNVEEDLSVDGDVKGDTLSALVSVDTPLVVSDSVETETLEASVSVETPVVVADSITSTLQPLVEYATGSITFATNTNIPLDLSGLVKTRGTTGITYNSGTKKFTLATAGYYRVDSQVTFQDIGPEPGWRGMTVTLSTGKVSQQRVPRIDGASTIISCGTQDYCPASTQVDVNVGAITTIAPTIDGSGSITIYKLG